MDTIKLIRSFKQGGTGNCVSIAVIKAGIQVFGLNEIFKHNWGNNICKVIMRDGYELSFTKDELEIAKQESMFIEMESKDVFDYATLCFAAMAKRAQIEKNDDIGELTFLEATHTLNDGEWYTHGADWLGLRFNKLNIKRKYIWQHIGVVGASRKHCFFCSEGIEDDYGRVDYVGLFEKRFCSWYRITKDGNY